MVKIERLMGKNAEHFFLQVVLRNTVVVVQRRLSAPADVKNGVHVVF